MDVCHRVVQMLERKRMHGERLESGMGFSSHQLWMIPPLRARVGEVLT